MGNPLARILSVNLYYRGEKRKLVLRKNRDETYLHILIKILAYVKFWDEELQIEPKYRYNKYRPDLLRLDNPINPKQVEPEIGRWIECKQVKIQKLDDLARYLQAEIHWFHTLDHLSKSLRPRLFKKYKRLSQINITAVDTDNWWHFERLLQQEQIRIKIQDTNNLELPIAYKSTSFIFDQAIEILSDTGDKIHLLFLQYQESIS